MAITNGAADGIRVTTAAKNGTLPSQTPAAADEIIFDTTIATNNGNLEVAPTFVGRKVIARQGASDEETKYITAISGDGLTGSLNETWVSAPTSGDTYHVSYRLADAETVGSQVTLNAKTGLYEFSRDFSIGNSGGGGAFAYFAITDYDAMEMRDDGANDTFTVEDNGRFDVGYLQGGEAIAGGVITSVKNTDGEPYMLFNGGAIAKLYAGIFWAQLTDGSITMTDDPTNEIDIQNSTFIKTADTTVFYQASASNITWQGDNRSADTFQIASGTVIDGIVLANTFGWTSPNDGVTETYEVRNCTFVGNSPNVTIYGDKTWNFVNPKLWEATGSQISFAADDLNTGSLKYSLDITVAQTDGSAITGSTTYVYEGLVNQDLPSDNRQTSDALGEATSDILKEQYTYPASTFTTATFGDFALKVYRYGFTPFVTSLTVDEALVSNVTLPVDSNLVSATSGAAITSGSGIGPIRHGTGETDPQPIKVMHYDGGTGAAPADGEVITGGSSAATGSVIEYIGTSTDGYLVLELWSGVEFHENEALTGDSAFVAVADLSGSAEAFYEEYTWELSGSDKTMSIIYDYSYAKIAEDPADAIWLNVIEWGEDEQSNLIYVGTDGYFTERNANLAEGVWISHRGTGDVAYMTADDGTQFIPPVTYSFTLTNLKTDSEIRIYNASTDVEIDGTESSTTSFSYSYTYTGDISIYVVIFHLNWKEIRLTGLTLSNSDQSIPIQQQVDRVYSNP